MVELVEVQEKPDQAGHIATSYKGYSFNRGCKEVGGPSNETATESQIDEAR